MRAPTAATTAADRASAAGRLGRRLLLAAAAAGLLHAASSLYWALGGRWLLPTVGRWAVELAQRRPLAAGAVLLVVAALKAAGAVLPALATAGRVHRPRLWRGLAWPGSVLLVTYGAGNTLVAGLVLAGAIDPDGGFDRQAMIGHALLWDPLFLLWGLLLAAGLGATRETEGGPRLGAGAPRASSRR